MSYEFSQEQMEEIESAGGYVENGKIIYSTIRSSEKVGDRWFFQLSKGGIAFQMGDPPSWIHRKMQSLLLGIIWTKYIE